MGQRLFDVDVDGEQAVEIGGPEDLGDGGLHPTEAELPAGRVDPAVETAERVEHGTGEELDAIEIEEKFDPTVVADDLGDLRPEVVERRFVDEPTLEDLHDVHRAVPG